MPEIKQYKITEPYLNLQGGLLEAPFWEKGRETLRFVDIIKKKLYFVNTSQGPSSLETRDLDFNIGCTADIEGTEKEFIFGGKYGYGIMNRDTGESRSIQKFWTDEERQPDGGGKPGKGETREFRMRANDGAVDVAGRFFVGAMDDPTITGPPSDEGVLFRLDPDNSIHRVKEGISIPNGISWTLDNKYIYFTDSPTGKIMKYPYDVSTGSIDWEKAEVFFQCPYEGGVPDGHAQDEEGCFWVALFGTGKVVRVDKSGQIIAEVECPTRCISCPGFVGTELYITSAGEEEPEQYAWSAKYQGSLFKIDVGVRGCPLNRYKNLANA